MFFIKEYNAKKIKEPDNLQRIESFEMEAVGLVFSFGIGYGGRKTIGDEGYLSMLNRNYVTASEQFQIYTNNSII